VVLVDGGLSFRELRRNLAPGGRLEHDGAALFGDDDVVFVEIATVLRDRVELAAERRPRLAVHGVRVRGRDHVGARLVNRGVDAERRLVDRMVAVHDVTVVVDEDEIRHPHQTETARERIHPEVVGILGVAHGDVPGDAFAETETTKDAQRCGKFLLALEPLFFDRLPRLWADVDEFFRGERDAVDGLRGARVFGDGHASRLGMRPATRGSRSLDFA